jgi:flagellar basal-body rod protein FlgB
MSTQSPNILALAERRLNWLDQRQSVLAQNIANANTPGYQARDLKPFAAMLNTAIQPATLSTGATLVPNASGQPTAPVDRAVVERSPDGNAVSIDEQAVKVADTDTSHQLALDLYKKYVGLFRLALGRG